jgi:ENTS family enterobactin (siderophore) exporter
VPRLLADLTPLRASRDFRRMWAGLSLAGIGTQLTNVAVGLQVYDLTRSTFSVGLVGLFAVVPLVVLGLLGGSLVDAFDRRRIALVASTGSWAVAVAVMTQAFAELGSVWLLYGLVAAQNACFAVTSPARTAIVPNLLARELLPAANALQNLAMNIGLTVGPLLAGLLVSGVGYGWAYAVDAVTLGVAVLTLAGLPPMPPQGEVRRAGLRSVAEGLRFLRTRPNVRMTFLADLAAMVLAQPRVLFPAVGAAVLGGGATTVGVLLSAGAVGSILAGVLSGPLGHVHRQGLAVLVSVAAWGVSVVGFGAVLVLAGGRPPTGAGATWLLWPATACLAAAGAADAVSSVFRTTILQAATPDAMRGRLQGVFIVVVAGGPRLGDVVLGAGAEVSTEAVAAVVGGLACIVVVLLLARAQPAFARYDAREPTP